jgi:hypothetical protein
MKFLEDKTNYNGRRRSGKRQWQEDEQDILSRNVLDNAEQNKDTNRRNWQKTGGVSGSRTQTKGFSV